MSNFDKEIIEDESFNSELINKLVNENSGINNNQEIVNNSNMSAKNDSFNNQIDKIYIDHIKKSNELNEVKKIRPESHIHNRNAKSSSSKEARLQSSKQFDFNSIINKINNELEENHKVRNIFKNEICSLDSEEKDYFISENKFLDIFIKSNFSSIKSNEISKIFQINNPYFNEGYMDIKAFIKTYINKMDFDKPTKPNFNSNNTNYNSKIAKNIVTKEKDQRFNTESDKIKKLPNVKSDLTSTLNDQGSTNNQVKRTKEISNAITTQFKLLNKEISDIILQTEAEDINKRKNKENKFNEKPKPTLLKDKQTNKNVFSVISTKVKTTDNYNNPNNIVNYQYMIKTDSSNTHKLSDKKTNVINNSNNANYNENMVNNVNTTNDIDKYLKTNPNNYSNSKTKNNPEKRNVYSKMSIFGALNNEKFELITKDLGKGVTKKINIENVVEKDEKPKHMSSKDDILTTNSLSESLEAENKKLNFEKFPKVKTLDNNYNNYTHTKTQSDINKQNKKKSKLEFNKEMVSNIINVENKKLKNDQEIYKEIYSRNIQFINDCKNQIQKLNQVCGKLGLNKTFHEVRFLFKFRLTIKLLLKNSMI